MISESLSRLCHYRVFAFGDLGARQTTHCLRRSLLRPAAGTLLFLFLPGKLIATFQTHVPLEGDIFHFALSVAGFLSPDSELAWSKTCILIPYKAWILRSSFYPETTLLRLTSQGKTFYLFQAIIKKENIQSN